MRLDWVQPSSVSAKSLNFGRLFVRLWNTAPGPGLAKSMTASDARHHTVLVVDDEPVVRLVAAEAFKDAGCGTYEACEAEEALQVLSEHPDISVLFTDINMPGGRDGVALAAEVHLRRPDVRLLLTSGREQPAPADIPDDGQFIAKPYALSDVTSLVRAWPLDRDSE